MKITVSVATSEMQHRSTDVRTTLSVWLTDASRPEPHFIFPSHDALQQFIAFLNESAAAFAPRVMDAAE